MNILYEDKDIVVAEKPAGLPVQTRNINQVDMVSILKNHLSGKTGGEPYLGIIHRLDQPVRGILVFALNEKAAGSLSKQIAERRFEKHYYAVVEGILDSKERIELKDYIAKTKENTAKIVNKGVKDAKEAVLFYTVLDTDAENKQTLLDIELMTGRFHQIRAQLSNAGFPIEGDIKYGAKPDNGIQNRAIKLCAYHLCFDHPQTGKRMEFCLDVREGFEFHH